MAPASGGDARIQSQFGIFGTWGSLLPRYEGAAHLYEAVAGAHIAGEVPAGAHGETASESCPPAQKLASSTRCNGGRMASRAYQKNDFLDDRAAAGDWKADWGRGRGRAGAYAAHGDGVDAGTAAGTAAVGTAAAGTAAAAVVTAHAQVLARVSVPVLQAPNIHRQSSHIMYAPLRSQCGAVTMRSGGRHCPSHLFRPV